MMILDAFNMYLGVKFHFNNQKYDYKKYNGKVGKAGSPAALEKRRDKLVFHKLAHQYNKKQFLDLLVSNFSINPKIHWAGEIASNEAKENLNLWHSRVYGIKQHFRNQVEDLFSYAEENQLSFNDLFRINKSGEWQSLPIVVNLVIKGFLSQESYVIIDGVLGLSKRYVRSDDPYLMKFVERIEKYKVFFNPQDSDFKLIMKSSAEMHGVVN